MTFLRVLTGALLLFGGLFLLVWIGYNLFVERLPQTQGRSPVPALVFATLLVAGGLTLIFKKA